MSDPTTSSRISRLLQNVANVGIIIAVIALLSVLIRDRRVRTAMPPEPPVIKAGDSLGSLLTDYHGPQARHLVLALSATCHFCSDSAPFYRRLVVSAVERGSADRLIAVFSQPPEVGKAYLHKWDIKITNVVQADYSQLNVVATPTLILVKPDGKVERVWVGKLTPDLEREVIALIS
jgi:hypothetical protein